MRKKNIVMFYRFRKPEEAKYFDRLGKKSSIYKYYFQKGTRLGFNMYFVSGADRYLGGLRFLDPLFFNGRNFSHKTGLIEADAIFDRSGGTSFPPSAIGKKVLNQIAFKKICWDKVKTYGLLKKYMPKSYAVKSKKELLSKLNKFSDGELIVLKPAMGLGGKGVIIKKKNGLKKVCLKKDKYILQEFVDTSEGIEKITEGKHDLRIAIANGKIVLAHIRTPRLGSLVANVAQGGSIKEIPLEKIPKDVLAIVQSIQSLFDKKFNYPLYAIDFGIANNRPYIFEINDQIGFPTEKMKNSKPFVNEILFSLKKLA
jgi:glutathione synthase/RimK-type ligase-like ATP-grasp enzyme